MDTCCESKGAEVARLREAHAGVLKTVLAINASLFALELTVGILANSTAVLADSLDMLGDAFVYGFSLWVLTRSDRWKAVAALLKGEIMLLFGLGVLAEALRRTLLAAMPDPAWMTGTAVVALAGNALCLFLLWRHRADDINMHSTWLCSRNDVIANLAVLAAGGAVVLLESPWPDLVVGFGIATLFLRTAAGVLSSAIDELRLGAA